MSQATRPLVLTPNQPQRRRSPRSAWRIPFIATWKQEKMLTVREQGETEVVNDHGALIKLSTGLPRGEIIRIVRGGAGAGDGPSKLARVANDLGVGPDGKVRLSVELDTPGLEFWTQLAR